VVGDRGGGTKREALTAMVLGAEEGKKQKVAEDEV
jgi:hypothetical protein